MRLSRSGKDLHLVFNACYRHPRKHGPLLLPFKPTSKVVVTHPDPSDFSSCPYPGPGGRSTSLFCLMLYDSSRMGPIPMPRTTTTEHEMERVVSGISSSRARADPSACINVLNPLINTTEGRKFLSEQEGETASALIELFDWVVIAPSPTLLPRGLKTWLIRH